MARNRLTELFEGLLNSNPFKNFYKKNRLRPPGAATEETFMELCIRCARCIEVCPYDSIERADLFEKLQIGTPYVFPDTKACYLCMRCMKVCPTGALDPKLTDGRKVRMGIAVINEKTCLNFLYYKDEMLGVSSTGTAQLCGTCYNVCPYTDEAIVMEKFILPVVTDRCTGCGICAEKCPATPEKAMSIYPEGMPVDKNEGYFGRRSKIHGEERKKGNDILKGEKLLQEKQKIDSSDVKPDFQYNTETYDTEW